MNHPSENIVKPGPAAQQSIGGPSAGSIGLHLIPVDPHRVFVRWRVNLDELELGNRKRQATLSVGFFRSESDVGAVDTSAPVDEFPVQAGWHEGFYSLSQPGGPVAAGLILKGKGKGAGFEILAMSGTVTLPEPVATLPENPIPHYERFQVPRKVPPGAEPGAGEPSELPVTEQPAVAAPLLEAPHRIPPVLDEAAIVSAATRFDPLPPELTVVPLARDPSVATPKDQEDLPQTPSLPERDVVVAALASRAVDEGVGATRILSRVLKPAVRGNNHPDRSVDKTGEPVGSSQRLASYFDPSSGEAPIRLEMTCHMHGRMLPGQRLRIGDREIKARPDGRFSDHQNFASFAAIWPVLHSLLARDTADDAPPFELLRGMRDSEASLVLHSSIEITGVLRDPSYRNLLPSEVEVDSAGCFRVERALPAGAMLLPHLVLLANGAGA